MSTGLRERKKAETRAALQDAALRLAEQHGLDKVSVEAIAEAAGVSPRTFFNYFPSKHDAIIGLSPSEPSPLLGLLQDRPLHESPRRAMRNAIRASVDRLQGDPDRWVLRRRLLQRHPDLAARHAARLAETESELVVEIARRIGVDPDLDPYPGILVGASMAATRVALTIWQNHDDPPPFADLIDQAFDLLASGLARPRT